jgi:hypothetical protein
MFAPACVATRKRTPRFARSINASTISRRKSAGLRLVDVQSKVIEHVTRREGIGNGDPIAHG